MSKINKGEYGYVSSQRRRVFVITLILYACALLIYFIGYYTLHTARNIWTIVAVLSILPASKSLVNLIMFMRFKSLDRAAYDEYMTACGDLPVIFEIPFTTYEKTYFVDAVVCRNNTVAACYLKSAGRKFTHEQELKLLTAHLDSVLGNDGYRDCSVKIYDDKKSFNERAAQMNENLKPQNPEKDKAVLRSLLSVGL